MGIVPYLQGIVHTQFIFQPKPSHSPNGRYTMVGYPLHERGERWETEGRERRERERGGRSNSLNDERLCRIVTGVNAHLVCSITWDA